ncbi:S24 family peptidase [Neisseria leonii]|uniref:DUF723 domain-containing protein n=1 Tax=Neisseria leonii TaxID=2995413 RepID=A0A9X4ID42_9NEIS|nr:S24 family peptidase [Neisseria sp. 51.81]MDD9326728.1 DUF723 domain-containing protein [Neisseria sp. 51.81]
MRKKTFEEAQREVAEKFGDRIRLVEFEASSKPWKIYCKEHGEQSGSVFQQMLRTAYGCPKCNREKAPRGRAVLTKVQAAFNSAMEKAKESLPEIADTLPDFDEIVETALVTNPLRPDLADVQVRYYPDVSFMGGEGDSSDVREECEYIPFDGGILKTKRIKAEKVACFKMKGDSMFPTLPEGSTVAVDEGNRTTIVNNGIYAVIYKGKRKVKRLKKLNPKMIMLLSDNPEYEDLSVFTKDVVIIGKVFWYQVIL